MTALPLAVARPEGLTYVEEWVVASVDCKELVKAVCEGRAPSDVVCADRSALNILCRNFKNSTEPPVVPGIVFRRVSNVRQK